MEKDGLVLGWYGKVPLSREFLRHHAAGPEVQELDQWFQEGILLAKSRLGAEWKTAYAEGDTWNFLFFPEGGNRLLVGAFAPSCDEVGREFPFFVFARVETASVKGTARLLPHQFGAFLLEARGLVQNGWMGLSLQEFRGRLEGLPAPSLESTTATEEAYQAFLHHQTADQFWTSIFGEFHHASKYRLDYGLQSSLEPLRQRPTASMAYDLKFPLMLSSQEEAFDLPYWLDLMSHWLGFHKHATVLLWNRQPAKVPPSLMVSLGKPSPKLILFIIRPDRDDRAWFDLAPSNSSNERDWSQYLSADRKRLLDEKGHTMGDILLKTGGV